ncbi:putative pyruvate decarboxylase [Helianthus debilis subsp. tardiflorus]
MTTPQSTKDAETEKSKANLLKWFKDINFFLKLSNKYEDYLNPRSRNVGACVVTFTVGGLGVLNAIAGAYCENLPLICIIGGPNSNDYVTNIILSKCRI